MVLLVSVCGSVGLLLLGQVFLSTGEKALREQGGTMDHKKEWEALDREMLRVRPARFAERTKRGGREGGNIDWRKTYHGLDN